MSKGNLSPGSRAFVKAVGSTLRALRREMGLYQEELADRAGIRPERIREIERGKHEPGITRLRLLALGLGLSPSRVLRRVEVDALDEVGGDVLRERAVRAIRALPLDDVLMLAEIANRMQRNTRLPTRERVTDVISRSRPVHARRAS